MTRETVAYKKKHLGCAFLVDKLQIFSDTDSYEVMLLVHYIDHTLII